MGIAILVIRTLALTRRRRLSGAALVELSFDAKRSHCLDVYLARGRKALLFLESNQGISGLGTQDSVNFLYIEPLIAKHYLNFPNLVSTQVNGVALAILGS